MFDNNMSHMARGYSHISANCYIACLWPKGDASNHDLALAEISKIGKVVYVTDIYLTYNGLKNFMVSIYGHQSWTGNIENEFNGTEEKVKKCYDKHFPTRTILFQADDFEKVVEAKYKIRDIYGIENHSIHISDNQAETEMMAELLYNDYSVKFLNVAKPFKFQHLYNSLPQFKKSISANKYDLGRFIIDSSSVMEVYGIREARDLDYLTDIPVATREIDTADKHDSQLIYYDIRVREMLYNPECYFVFNGVKFLDIDYVMKMKHKRGESKDKRDIKLTKRYLSKCNKVPIKFRQSTYIEIINYMKKHKIYGRNPFTFDEFIIELIKRPFREIGHISFLLRRTWWVSKLRGGYLKKCKKRLNNRNFTLISSNCNGGVVCSDFGVRFNSPFVNLFLTASDYIKLLQHFDYYMAKNLRFTEEVDDVYGVVDYPVAYLGDIKIYFMHYKSKNEAERIWNYRKERINKDNMFVIFTDRSGCTQKDLEDFDKLPYKNKVVFTHIPHPEINSAFYIKGYEDDEKVGILSEYRTKNAIKRVIYQFDFVKWFNGC